MSSIVPPSPENDYEIPYGQVAGRVFLQGIFTSIGERLRAQEATEADYDAAIDQITTQALAVVAANVADEVEAQRANLVAIQATLDDLLAEYEAVQAGGVPATGIAVATIEGLPGGNVQAVLSSVKAAIDAAATAAGQTTTTLAARVSVLEDVGYRFALSRHFGV